MHAQTQPRSARTKPRSQRVAYRFVYRKADEARKSSFLIIYNTVKNIVIILLSYTSFPFRHRKKSGFLTKNPRKSDEAQKSSRVYSLWSWARGLWRWWCAWCLRCSNDCDYDAQNEHTKGTQNTLCIISGHATSTPHNPLAYKPFSLVLATLNP